MQQADEKANMNCPELIKEDCLLAMERSSVKDIEIKVLLTEALTDQVNGHDAGCRYEGYNVYKTEDLSEK